MGAHVLRLRGSTAGDSGGLMSSTLALTRLEQEDHRAWLERGRTGEGRLVLEHGDLRHARRMSGNVSYALFRDVALYRVALIAMDLSNAEFSDCSWEESSLLMCLLHDVRFDGCRFAGGSVAITTGRGLRVTRCAFVGVEAESVEWQDAVIEDCSFVDVNFAGSVFSGVTFARCDLRGAKFSHQHPQHRPTRLAGARFEGCDLRGAAVPDDAGGTFVGCQR